jgi:hypothetical protein
VITKIKRECDKTSEKRRQDDSFPVSSQTEFHERVTRRGMVSVVWIA